MPGAASPTSRGAATIVDARGRRAAAVPALPRDVVLPGGLRALAPGEAASDGDGGEEGLRALRMRVCAPRGGLHRVARDVRAAHAVLVDGGVVGAGGVGCGGVGEAQVLGGGGEGGLRVEALDGVEEADVVAYVCEGDGGAEVLRALAEGVERVADAGGAVRWFAVLEGGLLVGVVGDEGDEECAASVERRRGVHEALGLAGDRVLLRRRCAAFGGEGGGGGEPFRADGGCAGRLADVHVGVKAHGLGAAGVRESLVRGRYLYCHYLQDGARDGGWGCAYRSLQTIASWAALGGGADLRGGVVPTHADIQRALVAVGDKPAAFVGSREWIGATEVCYALERLAGVRSRIVHVSSGRDMEARARELGRHFDLGGGPVMVGGGVLAWTILGVARDARTGRARFLILDPHYEGEDDVRVVQKKGWVAWRGPDAFRADAFYNLCLPQAPAAV